MLSELSPHGSESRLTVIGVFGPVDGFDKRVDVFEARLARMGFAGADPANVAGSGVEARFDAAMSFFDGGFRGQLVHGCGVEVVFNLRLQRWLIAFQRKHEIGLVFDDFGRDLHLTARLPRRGAGRRGLGGNQPDLVCSPFGWRLKTLPRAIGGRERAKLSRGHVRA